MACGVATCTDGRQGTTSVIVVFLKQHDLDLLDVSGDPLPFLCSQLHIVLSILGLSATFLALVAQNFCTKIQFWLNLVLGMREAIVIIVLV